MRRTAIMLGTLAAAGTLALTGLGGVAQAAPVSPGPSAPLCAGVDFVDCWEAIYSSGHGWRHFQLPRDIEQTDRYLG
jgi:hypothetical protein